MFPKAANFWGNCSDICPAGTSRDSRETSLSPAKLGCASSLRGVSTIKLKKKNVLPLRTLISTVKYFRQRTTVSKIQDFNEFELMASPLPVQCSINWVIKLYIGSKVLKVPVNSEEMRNEINDWIKYELRCHGVLDNCAALNNYDLLTPNWQSKSLIYNNEKTTAT